MVRKIAVITGTRAEYGILKPLLEGIAASVLFELQLYVTGLHLLSEYGNTVNEILQDGYNKIVIIEMYNSNYCDSSYYAHALGSGIKNFSNEFLKSKPDLIIVLGDRLEPLAATLAAATMNIPVAHIHGGDKTDSGHIDEQIRHSISKFAHLHLTATREHSDRLARMGEEQWRIRQVGALGLDSIKNAVFLSKTQLSSKLCIKLENEYIVCLFHSVTTQKDVAGEQMHELLGSLIELNIDLVIIYPNNDMGSDKIIFEIEKIRGLPHVMIFQNLEHIDYLNILKHSLFLIGNSSSGIIEAPSLHIPVINVGIRNFGRECAKSTIFVNPIHAEITEAIHYVLNDYHFKQEVKYVINPYGNGDAMYEIISVLKALDINERLLKKINTY